ncbi:hypothetical protein [Streptomyces subrutilus]|uniref:Tetratricopeptide repeat protein n=1 Tax=Streptomyces subrutilus TaxID=36818 RepID=A0A1E5PTW8_9ACTN|nr:hypothetical protein [Streptomyces subrutilus]OEJ32967.1 hypothetical protein BGK67_18045 [Streptomyces subrutilus]
MATTAHPTTADPAAADPAAAGTDPTMDAIGRAVTEGRAGETAAARQKLLGLWAAIGVTGDPLHRCSLAHYLADLYEDPAQALAWDVRALDAADAVTEQRVQEHDAGLHIAGFYPSLHLNLADGYRRLGSFEAAAEHISAAAARATGLPGTPYGDLLRRAIQEVGEAVVRRDRAPRESAPGSPA